MLIRRNKTGGYKMRVAVRCAPSTAKLEREYGLDTSNREEAYARARIALRIAVDIGQTNEQHITFSDANSNLPYDKEYIDAEHVEWTRRKRVKRKKLYSEAEKEERRKRREAQGSRQC